MTNLTEIWWLPFDCFTTALQLLDDCMVKGHLNPGLFNPKLQPRIFQPQTFQPWLKSLGLKCPLTQKFIVGKFMVEKSGVERSPVEAWGWKISGLRCPSADCITYIDMATKSLKRWLNVFFLPTDRRQQDKKKIREHIVMWRGGQTWRWA